MIGKLWLFTLGYVAGIFSKMSLSLQRKQLTVFLANDKILTFKQKLKYGKHVSITVSLAVSQQLNTFSYEIVNNISQSVRPVDFNVTEYKKVD